MVKIENSSVSAYVKSIVVDTRDYQKPVYWMVAVGTKVALQGLFAQIVSKKTTWLSSTGGELEAWPREYGRRWENRSVGVPGKGKMHALYKKLQSGLSAMVMYSSFVKTDVADDAGPGTVLLMEKDEEREDVLFHFLKSRIRVPMHESWKGWAWVTLSRNNDIRDLFGYGMSGYFINAESCERTIEKHLPKVIKHGFLKVEGGG